MINFKKWFKFLTEKIDDETTTQLITKEFEGLKHQIKISVIKYISNYKPKLQIKSLIDPKINGFLEYDTKKEAVIAFNHLESLIDVLNFIKRYKTESSMYDLIFLLNDELGETESYETKEDEFSEFDREEFSEPNLDGNEEGLDIETPDEV